MYFQNKAKLLTTLVKYSSMFRDFFFFKAFVPKLLSILHWKAKHRKEVPQCPLVASCSITSSLHQLLGQKNIGLLLEASLSSKPTQASSPLKQYGATPTLKTERLRAATTAVKQPNLFLQVGRYSNRIPYFSRFLFVSQLL